MLDARHSPWWPEEAEMSWDDTGRLLLRGSLAAVFGYAAVKHGRARAGTTSWIESTGYRDPNLSWIAMTGSEAAAAVSVLLGLGTTAGAAAINGTMTSATLVVHRQNGWPEEKGGVEWPVTLVLMATALAVLGPGRWSLDHAVGLDKRLDHGAGLVLALGGVAAGAAQVALLWEKPEPAPDSAGATSR
jgi:putative oxidoreductase